jgi:V/A-type H+/Na+-transporting ATPase subunit I
MIVPMARVRILGPRTVLPEAIQALQDLGVFHLAPPATKPLLEGSSLSPKENHRRRALERALAEVEGALAALDSSDAVATSPGAPTVTDLARWTRLAHRVRQQLAKLSERITRAEEEQALLAKYHDAFAAFARLVEHGTAPADAAAFHLVLRADQADARPRLEAGLRELVGPAYESFTQRLASGETAMLLVVPRTSADRVERLLADTQVHEAPVPSGFGPSLADALPRMRERETAIPRELAAFRRERDSIARRHVAELVRAQAALRDRLARTEAISQSAVTPHAFVLEGWLPMAGLRSLTHSLESRFGGLVVVEVRHQEPWRAEDAPVVLHNPRLFRPFELLTRMLPLPRYGSIDPTPYVAVFFPMFFGLIVGDLGYGGIMALASLILHRRSAPGSTLRAVAKVGGACALFSLIFGALFGELFGDLGRRVLGLRPLWFNREVAIVPFLVLTISLGVVHLLLGLVLGALSRRRSHPRQALGRGLSAVMLTLVTVAILAALEVLPKAVLSPAAIALLVAFPVLVILEGVVAPVELITTLGHVLSYARIMALGTASVMLAVVANRLAGAVGSVVVGVLFALLFHLVNFALALFSPTIHALRLHYVEFFGTFYSPGGTRYQPLSHWTPKAGQTA